MSNEELVQLIQSGDDQDGSYMMQLWQQNTGLIGMVAKRYAAYEDIEDLKQQGFLGLYDAVHNFNPDAGASFAHYALFRIRQSVQRYIEDCSGSVRIPVHRWSDISKYMRLCADFQKSVGRKPTQSEICSHLGVNRKALHGIEEAVRMGRISSIDMLVCEEGDVTVGDLLPGNDNVEDTVMEEVQQEQLAKELWQQVDSLPEQQAATLRMRYKQGLTLKQTAERLERTPERIRQLQEKALLELRKPSRSVHLRPFLDEYIYNRAVQGNGTGRFNRTWTSSTEREAIILVESKSSKCDVLEQLQMEIDAELEKQRKWTGCLDK
ncbi:MAG: sigma-70 family RNA polymerase sigma factor [Hominisplanchenecus sp.]|nr:sigma-70 family RNA polymerase sigma factor [Lachnospiraceae bacterium]MDY2820242.1 sigma-70 family RNA polymerase sigma factor [Hominisplanchenecus sp.]